MNKLKWGAAVANSVKVPKTVVELFDIKSLGNFELPHACPHCKASFLGEDSALREWTYHDTSCRVFVDDGRTEVISGDDSGDSFFPIEYWCTACNQQLKLKRAK